MATTPMSGTGDLNRNGETATAFPDRRRPSSWYEELSALLLRDGLADGQSIDRARDLCARTGRGLGEILVDMGVLSEEQMFGVYGVITGLPVWNGRGEPKEQSLFSTEFLVFNRVLPVTVEGDSWLVVSDPEDDGLIDMLQRLAPSYHIALAPEDEVVRRLQRHFDVEVSSGATSTADAELGDVDHLKDLALEAPIVRQLNDILFLGAKLGASDIHLEPMRNRVELRYRLDGVLQARPGPTLDDYPAVLSRMKILSGLDIAERRLPQDGRYGFRFAGHSIDIRVSTVPTAHGEDLVLRLLNQNKQLLDLSTIDLSAELVAQFRETLRRSRGLILVTGPTGSGKTTTLYAGLNEIVDGEKKIITIEDPVEYEISGITQIQAHPEIGLSFADALRHILRHDPDVILIGEIRDRDTAEIAVAAAQTGHLVLSTVHTNDAIGAVGRLIKLGVADFMLAGSLLAVTGQRLVRRLCLSCRRTSRISPEQALRLGIEAGRSVYVAVGCPECDHTGYVGRVPIGEFLKIDAGIREIILSRPTVDALTEMARERGFRSMLEDGVGRVLHGTTTVEEVLRVVG